MDNPSLNVSSSCPSNPSFSFSLPLPAHAPSPSSTADKTAALAALGDAIASTQASINQRLTARMEEDKLRAAAAAEAEGRAVGPAIDEDKEEQNYGEEVQEEED